MSRDLRSALDRARLPARLAFLGLILLATLTALHLDTDPTHVAERLGRALHPGIGASDAIDGIRNLALFAGWGVVWMATCGTGATRRHLLQALASGAAISLAVETLQLFSPVRNASLLDVATNTIGTAAGAAGFVILVQAATRLRGRQSFVGVPALILAGSYGLACFVEAAVPLFRQETVLGASGGPVARFAAVAAAFTINSLWDLPVEDFLLLLPAGVLVVAALVEAGASYPVAMRRTIALGSGLAILAELLHGPNGQPIVLGAVVVHAGAVGVGALLGARLLPDFSRSVRGPARPRLVLRGLAALIALWALRPWIPEILPLAERLTDDWWVPLAALGGRMEVFSVADVVGPFFLYFPLGALLAVWPWRQRGWMAGLWPALWLALATEALQLFIQGRFVDVTDPLIQVSGAVVGWTIVRRAGYRPYGEAGP
ncbi:MAG TPA: VanZ family protein [Gemmatimonadales bacterium]|nr:VanZ family protein [Gemmatimonadales bacterium]